MQQNQNSLPVYSLPQHIKFKTQFWNQSMSLLLIVLLCWTLSCQSLSQSHSSSLFSQQASDLLQGAFETSQMTFQTAIFNNNLKNLHRVHLFDRELASSLSSQSSSQKQKTQNNENTLQGESLLAAEIIKTRRQRIRVAPPLSQTLESESSAQDLKIANILANATYLQSGITYSQVNNAISWRKLIEQPRNEPSYAETSEYLYYERKYKISEYEQKPICVVVPTYNNVQDDRHLRNIKSIVMQNYTNYHIVVFDDASTDDTGKAILNFLRRQSQLPAERYQVVINEIQMKAMFNLRLAATNFCKPEELFMIVDGDDELIGKQVFKLYNSLFQRQNVWFVYTNFLHSTDIVGFSRPYPQSVVSKNNYRLYPLVASHLRVFYTHLFQNVKQTDLRDSKGDYYRAANDVAICVPILQQAHRRVRYVPQLTYYYNINTGHNNHILRTHEQRKNDRRIRRKSRYQPLSQLFQK